ncbi:ribonuclease HII [Luteibacter sp. Sphag1AF]|uniref:ribonuclease HII n=1 Tax=Luteibacter sp. Sphag1AF TaxID=2587031 RepID=UPI001622692F|nr:ribonuclease HII [Luteibacter sp. Sphag1AF]MBB3225761.1 ribonuclease HII [Luteibacter sp. Sphag1AF]
MPRKRNVSSRLEPGLIVAGVDEAGRGPLAGPVVVAAVILDPARAIRGLNDSKQLNESVREKLFDRIIERALAFTVVFVERDEIDRINIFQATMTGMTRSLMGLSVAPQVALIDGNRLPKTLPCQAHAVIGGDATEPAISAASILAKVSRDRHMHELDARYPGYGFARHKGYGVPEHLDALERLGPCDAHRRSFAPVRRWFEPAAGEPVADLFAPAAVG